MRPSDSQWPHFILDFNELIYIQDEDGCSSDLDFDREGRITSDIIGSGGRNDFSPPFAFFTNDFDTTVYPVVFGPDDQRGVPCAQETAACGKSRDEEIGLV